MFCTGCGTQSIDSGLFCGGCGTAQPTSSSADAHLPTTPAVYRVGQAVQQNALPDGIRGWSWGAFFLSWIWAIGNQTWIGLLALIPYVNLPVAIWLGLKGREMAWRNREWDSVAHFNQVQRKWSQWGIGFAVIFSIITMVFMLMIVYSALNKSQQEAGESVEPQATDVVSTHITSRYKTG